MSLCLFKNESISNETRRKIIQKACESLLIFCDITHTDISFSRENINFILVYDYEKNKHKINQDDESASIQHSESLGFIANHVMKKSKQHLIHFKLDRLKTIYFNDVFTLTPSEFDKNFKFIDIIT